MNTGVRVFKNELRIFISNLYKTETIIETNNI